MKNNDNKSFGFSYNKNWLFEEISKGREYHYIFFWKPILSKSITESCLSQWYPWGFELDNIAYKTAEHWMMSQKALLFNDFDIYKEVLASDDSGQVQMLGKRVKNFDLKRWENNSFRIVCEGNYHKFKQNECLANYLLSTSNSILVEASPIDRIWGIGLTSDDERATNPYLWRGSNLLGFALMEVRDQLKRENDGK